MEGFRRFQKMEQSAVQDKIFAGRGQSHAWDIRQEIQTIPRSVVPS